MINLDPALGEQPLHIAIGQPLAQIPAHRDRDHHPRKPIPRRSARRCRARPDHPASVPVPLASTNATTPPSGYQARWLRAHEHYKSIGKIWSDHLSTRPHWLERNVGSDGRCSLRFVRERPIPGRLALILGEFLYQLRASLDNCPYEVAIIDSGQDPPPNAELLEWPIHLTPETWTRQARRYAALSAEIRDALEAIQPYRAKFPDWNALRILHDFARIDRHRTLHLVTSFSSYAWAKVNPDLIADLDVHLGVVPEDGVIATFRWLGDGEITPYDFDLDFEFQIEMAGVTESLGPGCEVPARPYGPLDKGLHALLRAVAEYSDGLVAIAQDVAGRTVSSPASQQRKD